MIKIHNKYKSSVMASMIVNKKTVNRWGIYSTSKNLDKKKITKKSVGKESETKNDNLVGKRI